MEISGRRGLDIGSRPMDTINGLVSYYYCESHRRAGDESYVVIHSLQRQCQQWYTEDGWTDGWMDNKMILSWN